MEAQILTEYLEKKDKKGKRRSICLCLASRWSPTHMVYYEDGVKAKVFYPGGTYLYEGIEQVISIIPASLLLATINK